MMMTTMFEFLALIGKPTRNRIDLNTYYGHTFRCACGYTHIFDTNIEVLCEGYWRLILSCPVDNRFITNARARMILIQEYGGLAAGYGACINNPTDQAELHTFMAAVLNG